MRTLFFTDSEFEGKSCKVAVANYLAFLSLRGSDVAGEVARLREALGIPTAAHRERDLCLLLRARNWRFHNIACVAIACCDASKELTSELWEGIRLGSWTSPQLAATAAYIDAEFRTKALALLESHGTYYKSIVALAALLENADAEWPAAALSNIAEAREIDRDDSGNIAVAWKRNLQEAFGET